MSTETIIMGRIASNTKHKYIHIVVEHLTQFLWTYPTMKNDINTIVTGFEKLISSKVVPSLLINDNGKNYMGNNFKSLLNKYKIKHTFTTPFYSQSNGLVENVITQLFES